MTLYCVVLAAGLGTRMNSEIPKVLHSICGIPMLQAVLNTAKKLRPRRIVVVIGKRGDLVRNSIACKDAMFVVQRQAKGTGDALRRAQHVLADKKAVVLVLNGDTPLLSDITMKQFLSLHYRAKNAVSVLSFKATNNHAYGRIVRDGSGRLLSIVEEKDANPEQKKIEEVNSGVYAMNRDAFALLDMIKINRAKGEYYVTDIVAIARGESLPIAAYCIGSEEELMGVNTRGELARASRLMKKRIIEEWIDKGVIFLDAESVFVHPHVTIGKGTTIYPNVYLDGHTTIGGHSVIYPNVRIQDSHIGKRVVIKDSCVIENSLVRDRASVGPFARIRPGSEVGTEARIGNFVELKKAVIGKRSKASHLSYIGDALIGKDVNVGAGTITCNYDGARKHKTEIRDNVFIGSDTQLVAPVRIGRGAYVGAGSTITQDVPPLSLALSRARQVNVEGWALNRRLKVKSSKHKKKVVRGPSGRMVK
ncbi:MAG TPA: bifunctional UDP-N-acetylglucosamine diphosphorylase/glucosamine-1-phosphate N-acetyltransferase GlmU [Thermodesulfovibrionales bacterium]|nr:bifunctional UDP-N-acetylglucosamine diphosphorylase/glucosamine-1-phosphate N-acetyltransferase GlmU [Thermodesulfovibrionales bacterium]